MADTLQHQYKPGDRVRVVNRVDLHFDDYDNGDTAVVTRVPRQGDWSRQLEVRWENARFTDDREGRRLCAVFPEEVELIEPANRTFPMPALTAAEVAMVLAGLRMLQTFAGAHHDRMPAQLLAILEDGGIDGPLGAEAIDDLCDRINRA